MRASSRKRARKERSLGVLTPDDLHDAGTLGALDAPGGGEVDLAHAAAGEQAKQGQPPKPARQHLTGVP